MKTAITISLSPNAQGSDVRTALAVLLRPWKWREASFVARATEAFVGRYPGFSATLTSSGRQALLQLLRATSVGKGDEVIIQAFTCSAVPAAIQWAGATPVYADINRTTFNLDPASVAAKISSRTRAIIVQHTFGIPGPIAELRTFTQQGKLLLIEDCAHALGATYKNEPVGTCGDAAFFSFGRDKTISSVFGGAVISRNVELIKKIEQQQVSLPYPPSWWVKQQLFHPILFSIIVPLYFKRSLGKLLLVAAQKLHLLSKAVTAREKKSKKPNHLSYRFSPALARLLQLQLTKLNAYTKQRRHTAQYYIHELHGLQGISIPFPLPSTEPAWLRFPLLVSNSSKLRQRAQKQHMLLGDWYDTPIAPRDVSPSSFNYQPGSCPVAEDVAKHIINLPTHAKMTDASIQQVVNFLRHELSNKGLPAPPSPFLTPGVRNGLGSLLT